MTRVGEYDCANPKCDRYHVLVERRMNHPRCVSCGKRLRLVRVFQRMSEEAKRRLRELRAGGAA